MDKKVLEYLPTGEKSPGPAAYCIKPTIGTGATDPSIEKNPAYSIKGRKPKNICSIGPGPVYTTYGVFRDGKYRTPGGVLNGRLANPQLFVNPGPADYCIRPEKITGGYRMQKEMCQKSNRDTGPAPNQYVLPDTLNRQGANLANRFKVHEKCPTPGPYDLPPMDLYLKGRFQIGRTIGERWYQKPKCPTPGPADYNNNIIKCNCKCPKGVIQPCGISFGKRSAKYSVFAVPDDNIIDDDCLAKQHTDC